MPRHWKDSQKGDEGANLKFRKQHRIPKKCDKSTIKWVLTLEEHIEDSHLLEFPEILYHGCESEVKREEERKKLERKKGKRVLNLDLNFPTHITVQNCDLLTFLDAAMEADEPEHRSPRALYVSITK